jgi:hypothetical protein
MWLFPDYGFPASTATGTSAFSTTMPCRWLLDATLALFGSGRDALLSVAGYQRMVMANDGRDTQAIQHYLGHCSIASTVRYTALAPDRFKHFWKD